MNVSDRRRQALRDVSDFLHRAQVHLDERARTMHYAGSEEQFKVCRDLASEARDLHRSVLIASMPDADEVLEANDVDGDTT